MTDTTTCWLNEDCIAGHAHDAECRFPSWESSLSCSALWSRNQGVSCCVTTPHTVHRGSSEPDAPTWDDTGCAPGTLHDGRGGR